jgi:hypothetical protein
MRLELDLHLGLEPPPTRELSARPTREGSEEAPGDRGLRSPVLTGGRRLLNDLARDDLVKPRRLRQREQVRHGGERVHPGRLHATHFSTVGLTASIARASAETTMKEP